MRKIHRHVLAGAAIAALVTAAVAQPVPHPCERLAPGASESYVVAVDQSPRLALRLIDTDPRYSVAVRSYLAAGIKYVLPHATSESQYVRALVAMCKAGVPVQERPRVAPFGEWDA